MCEYIAKEKNNLGDRLIDGAYIPGRSERKGNPSTRGSVIMLKSKEDIRIESSRDEAKGLVYKLHGSPPGIESGTVPTVNVVEVVVVVVVEVVVVVAGIAVVVVGPPDEDKPVVVEGAGVLMVTEGKLMTSVALQISHTW